MAGTELGKAYVQIVPSARGLGGSIEKMLGGEANSAGKRAGLNITGGIKKAIIAGGIGVVLKKTLDAGGALQQSLGGLDTIYGKAAEAAKNYAKEAYQAGISQNTYAEQAVSFGAALKQAYGGDTAKAVEAANTAILDMADNAAKMGTPVERLQDAYQGFAKQNYTMLDNLKLGYGGTKTEMERLLADAEKLSGQEYDISNLGDVYEAIHVIQEDLGLTGVAAMEASETFTGSFNAMKASAENFMANLMLGQDVGPAMENLVTTATTFLFNNLLPAVGNIIANLPSAIATGLQTAAPLIVQQGGQLITNLIDGIKQNGPQMVQGAKETIESFVDYVGQNLPAIADKGADLIQSLVKGLIAHGPEIAVAATKVIAFLVKNLVKLASQLASAGLKLIGGLAKGILGGVGSLLGAAMNRVKTQITKPIDQAKALITAAIDKIKSVVNGAKLSLPHISLPHFSISGSFGLNPPSVPHFSVSWYRKAEEMPYLFSKPTFFGAGEGTQDEILYGRRALMNDIREASGGGKQIIINNYMEVNGAENPEEYANRFVRQMKLQMRTE